MASHTEEGAMLKQLNRVTAAKRNESPIRVRYSSRSMVARLRRHLRRANAFARAAYGARNGCKPISGPIWAHIGLARRCNYQCVMCPLYAPDAADSAKEFLKSYREDMPLDMARQLAADLARMGTVSVEFIGNGEPMLHRQFPAVVEAFRQQRLEVILYTNGSRLTRDTVPVHRIIFKWIIRR
jgi:uncharacterized radical SAM superfamily Fe-S cluster-containing enzyme